MNIKPVVFIGTSRRALKNFPDLAREQAGGEIWELQKGQMPDDWKPMPDIGAGALEICVHNPYEYRVICVAKLREAIYVLHAFPKKTQKTPKKDLEVAKKAYAQIKNIK